MPLFFELPVELATVGGSSKLLETWLWLKTNGMGSDLGGSTKGKKQRACFFVPSVSLSNFLNKMSEQFRVYLVSPCYEIRGTPETRTRTGGDASAHKGPHFTLKTRVFGFGFGAMRKEKLLNLGEVFVSNRPPPIFGPCASCKKAALQGPILL